MNATILELSEIHKHYANGDTTVRALDGVSLKIRRGEFVAIMGQSGSGKSTLMNILGCLDRPTTGSYKVLGREAANLEPDELASLRRETFGFVFQKYNLLATATAGENVQIPSVYAGLPKHKRAERAASLLARLGLGDRTAHRPSELSGGQQQRVAIARALVNDPPVILADEPTGALDSKSGDEVLALLKQLHAEGRTIILITHAENVAQHAGRIVRIQDGRILEDTGRFSDDATESVAANHRSFESAVGLMASVQEALVTAWRSLRVNIFRTMLTLLGIIIGVAAVVAMLAVGEGSRQKVLDRISSFGTNLMLIRPGAAGIRNAGDIATLVPDDAAAIKALPNVETALAERSSRLTVRYGNLDYQTSAQGTSEDFPSARDWPVAEGQFFNADDMKHYAAVVVLGRTVAKTLFPDGSSPIGKYVLMRSVPFVVIGVMSEKGASPNGSDQDDVIFVPINTGLVRLFGKNYLSSITIKVKDSSRHRSDPGARRSAAQSAPQHRGLQRAQHGVVSSGRHGNPGHLYFAARHGGGDLAAGRRHRRDEHHAGQRRRAHPRDRHSHGHRRAHARHHAAIQHRSRGGLRRRRYAGHSRRHDRRPGAALQRYERNLFSDAGGARLCLRFRHRLGVRLFAGTQSRSA